MKEEETEAGKMDETQKQWLENTSAKATGSKGGKTQENRFCTRAQHAPDNLKAVTAFKI